MLLAAILGAGLFGAFGGQPDPVRQVRTDIATIGVRAPRILRNGMIFETVIEVKPQRPVGNLVIAISDGLWREMTINTTMPSAQQESDAQGVRRFSFGRVEAGKTFRFKIDGQINPPLFAGTSGEIAAYDGEKEIASLPIRMRVLP